ncbi:MAG: hypothetical protein ACN6OY_22015, partial [Pseudomonas alloputida]
SDLMSDDQMVIVIDCCLYGVANRRSPTSRVLRNALSRFVKVGANNTRNIDLGILMSNLY